MGTLVSDLRPGETAPAAPPLVDWLDSVLRNDSPFSVADDLPLLFEDSDRVVRRTILSGDALAAHAAARLLDIRTPRGTVAAAIIGAVATDAKFRRQGLGSQVIDALLADLRARGVSLAVLWADVPKFYDRLGFVLAGRESVFVCPREAWRPPRRMTIRRAFPEDLPEIRALHERETCRVQRDDDVWRTLFAIPHTCFYVIEREGPILAYGVVGKGHDLGGCVHEWGGEDVLLPVLVSGIFRLRTDGELYAMSAPWKQQAARAMTFHGVRHHVGPLAMFKVLDRHALLRSLAIADPANLPDDHGDLVRTLFGCASVPEPAQGAEYPVPFYLAGLDSM